MVNRSIRSVQDTSLIEPASIRLTPRQPRDSLFRLLDVGLALGVLILSLPLIALIALAISLDSPGPVLFRQRRIGRGTQPFTILKFRTMRENASPEPHRRYVEALIAGQVPSPPADGPLFKLHHDDRVTRIGRLLRGTSLDELPQLWNVLRGEMSIVGPRPAISYEVERYPAAWFRRFEVKPGITGLWQVSGRCDLTHEQMMMLDLAYVDRRSLMLNLQIILRTVPAVLSRRGAS